MAVSAPPPDLQRLSLGRESFAVSCPLALLGAACYPVRVPRPADALAASFGAPLTVGAWRSAWVVTTNSPEDFHLQAIVHAGRTKMKPAWTNPCGLRTAKLAAAYSPTTSQSQ